MTYFRRHRMLAYAFMVASAALGSAVAEAMVK